MEETPACLHAPWARGRTDINRRFTLPDPTENPAVKKVCDEKPQKRANHSIQLSTPAPASGSSIWSTGKNGGNPCAH